MEQRKLGRYEIVGELGKGAMGVVYCARDPLLDRTVAIKTINMALAQDEMKDYEARFYQEAKAAGGLNHPNIVIIYDIGKSGNIAYMAMELLHGRELKTLMTKATALPVAYTVDVAAQIAEGLGYAHEHGIVHRDVKPANIMIVRGEQVKITDFGIARMRSAIVQTQVGIVLGSPRYMSPEQVAGKRAEPRSDNFSLGVIVYEMLTGRPPFNGEDVTSVMFQILNLVPPPPSAVNAEVPEMLDFIIAKALAKSPADRYANASEMAADLRECQKRMEATGNSPAAAHVASKPTTTTFNPGSAADLLARTAPSERRNDKEVDPNADTAEQSAPAALGLSKAFDSLDATMRLAVNTGMTTDMKSLSQLSSDNSGVNASPGYHIMRELGWTTRDKFLFAAAVIGAVIAGAFIVYL